MIYFLVGLLCLGGLALAAMTVVEWGRSKRSGAVVELRAARQALRESESALRQIANGTSGNDVLTAQIALDEINNYYENRKELA